MWNPEHFANQWFIDAFTVDPDELLKDRTGIYPRGRPRFVQQCDLINASVGSLPKVQVYIAVHQDFGTLVFYPYHGAKHGGRSEKKDANMYEGYRYWTSELSDTEKEQIRTSGYYNYSAAIEAIRKKGGGQWEDFNSGDFHPKHFTVRTLLRLQVPAAPSASPLCFRER